MYQRIILFFAMTMLLSACHVGRFFRWGFADIKDNKKFASTPIAHSTTNTFKFKPGEKNPLILPDSLEWKKKMYQFEDFLKKTQTVGFMMIRNDSILYEKYLYDYNESSEIPSFSIAKSFVSALVGIAIHEGKIKSVQDPITDYLPELDKAELGQVTIDHLLNMRSGIKFNEGYFNPFGNVAKYYYGNNLKKYIRQLKMRTKPDKVFEYKSVNTQLLAFIVENATGKKIAQYLEEKIWKPLGMEYPATWSIDSKRNQNVKAFCCLNGRMRDFAKFGRLYLHKGNWNGQQIIPKDWVAKSDQPLKSNMYMYANQWWHRTQWSRYTKADSLAAQQGKEMRILNGPKGKLVVKPSQGFFAEGHLGQFIFVHPPSNTIIVRMGKKDRYFWPHFFERVAKRNAVTDNRKAANSH